MCSSYRGSQSSSSSKDQSKGEGDEDGGSNNASASTSNGSLRRRIGSGSATSVTSEDSNATSLDTSESNPLIIRFSKLVSAKNRTIYVMYFIAFLDLLAVSLFMPHINGEIRKLGASHFMTGLIGSAYGAVQLISSPVMGRGSDKYGQKPVMVACLLATALAYVIQGVAVTMAFFLIARALSGTFKHTQTLGKSIVSELTPKEKSYVLGNFNAFGSMGFILGPTIGAHLYVQPHGFRTICCLSAVAFVINAILLLLLVTEPSRLNTASHTRMPPTPTPSQFKAAESRHQNVNPTSVKQWTSVQYADMHTIILLAVRFLFSFATVVFRENLGYTLRAKYGTQVVEYGYLTSLQALMSTVIGFAVGPINTHIYKGNSLYMVLITGILKTTALLVLFFTSQFSIAATMLITISALNPFLRVGVTTVSLEGHQDQIGTILGMSQSATSMARMLSPTMAGFTLGMSVNGPFLVAATSAACGIIATLIAQKFSAGREGAEGKGQKKEEEKVQANAKNKKEL